MTEDPIKSIFFEHQQASLCAQHALNMLLQDNLFTVETLRDIARQMDRMENEILGNGADAVGKSENMDDTGFFSIQVIEKALDAFDIKLINFENPVMSDYKTNPLIARAYVCNLQLHWFVLRKFGNQWFELNSTKEGPRLLSDTYVQEFLHMLSVEKYSIFVVQGILPHSYADELITLCPVVPTPRKETKEPNVVQKIFNTVGRRLGGGPGTPDSQEDRDLAIAMANSMETEKRTTGREDEEEQLRKAIEMSLGTIEDVVEETKPTEAVEETPILGTSSSSSPASSGSGTPSVEQQRKDRQKFLERVEQKKL